MLWLRCLVGSTVQDNESSCHKQTFQLKQASPKFTIFLRNEKAPHNLNERGLNSSESNVLGDRHIFAQEHILNRIQQGHAVFHRLLKRLPSRNDSDATGTFVNHRRLHRLLQVVLA